MTVQSVTRLADWTIGADRTPGASPPIREVECTSCRERSDADTGQLRPDVWAIGHTGATGHTGFREIVTAFLRVIPAPGNPLFREQPESGHQDPAPADASGQETPAGADCKDRTHPEMRTSPMGSISNGVTSKPYDNLNALGLDWRKSSRTDLDPILKDCVIVAEAPDAIDHPHDSIPDGTRMIALSDDKDPDSPVLYYSRAEFTKFAEGIRAGEFDDLMATTEEMEQAATVVAV